MITFPILSLLYFTQPFVLESDASSEGIGEVLMHNRHPIYFECRNLRESKKIYTIYYKDMLAIMHALSKFRQYLVGGCFVVRIDHKNLRYFLEEWDLNER
jgi:hypothetical protein